jgi:hypothetical protein
MGGLGLNFDSVIASTGPPSGNLLYVLLHTTEPVAEWLRWNINNSVSDLNGVQTR